MAPVFEDFHVENRNSDTDGNVTYPLCGVSAEYPELFRHLEIGRGA
jgi:hypothetical protein